MRAALRAHADGVNAWVAGRALPADYARLQLTKFEPWTPLDSITIGKLISLEPSFDFDSELTPIPIVTGIAGIYDAADVAGVPSPPAPAEIDTSVAAAIYAVWRGRAIANAVDRTLDGFGVPLPASQEATKALRHPVERNGIGVRTIDFLARAGAARTPACPRWAPTPDRTRSRNFGSRASGRHSPSAPTFTRSPGATGAREMSRRSSPVRV